MTLILSDANARAKAAVLIDRYSNGYRSDGYLITEILDALSADVLRLAGVSDPGEARAVLFALWGPR